MTGFYQSADGSRVRFTVPGTVQLVTGPGILNRLIVSLPGTTMTVDLYDSASDTSNSIYQYLTADGKVNLKLDVPFANGLRVVVGGTPGEFSIVHGQHKR